MEEKGSANTGSVPKRVSTFHCDWALPSRVIAPGGRKLNEEQKLLFSGRDWHERPSEEGLNEMIKDMVYGPGLFCLLGVIPTCTLSNISAKEKYPNYH